MVKLMAGPKGTGKSKQLVKTANEAVLNAKGNMIFIDDDNRPMHELDHKIRFIDLSELPVKSAEQFFGFVCGVISSNYDIEKIYVDGIVSFKRMNEKEIEVLLEGFELLSDQYNIDFFVTLNHDEPLSDKVMKYAK